VWPLLLSVLLSMPLEAEGVKASALEKPPGKGPFPAVLLVEGWWQAGTWEKSAAERLVADGYLVLTVMPDRGERSADRDAMHAAMTSPPSARSLAGLRAAGAWRAAREDVRGKRFAVLGARMGGRDALYFAGEPGVAAAVRGPAELVGRLPREVRPRCLAACARLPGRPPRALNRDDRARPMTPPLP
jgi:dienelactone hydrolase